MLQSVEPTYSFYSYTAVPLGLSSEIRLHSETTEVKGIKKK